MNLIAIMRNEELMITQGFLMRDDEPREEDSPYDLPENESVSEYALRESHLQDKKYRTLH